MQRSAASKRECGQAPDALIAISIRLCRAIETNRRADNDWPNRARLAYHRINRAADFPANCPTPQPRCAKRAQTTLRHQGAGWRWPSLIYRQSCAHSPGCRDDEVPAEMTGQPLKGAFGERAAWQAKLFAPELVDDDLTIAERLKQATGFASCVGFDERATCGFRVFDVAAHHLRRH